MESRAQYLAVLGLPPDASNEDATAAYKDLIRVWHPDRFQNDDRLRRKAEDETKKLNSAIAKVKKLPRESTKSKGGPSSGRRPNRHGARNATTPQEDDFAKAYGPRTTVRQNIEISPLDVKQRPETSLLRFFLGVLVVAASVYTIISPPVTQLKSAGMIALVFIGTNMAMSNIALFFFPRQRIRVDKFGLYIQGIGRLFWPDVQRVWVGKLANVSFLSVNFTEDYLQRQNYILQLLYRLRGKLRRAHTGLSFSGLNSDAVQVVDAITLRHHTGHICVPNVRTKGSPSLFWCNFISLTCPVMVLIRCLTQDALEEPDYLPYAAIFLACRLYAITVTTILARPEVVK